MEEDNIHSTTQSIDEKESVYTREKLSKLDEISNKAAIEYSEDHPSEDVVAFREKFINEYIKTL